MLRLLLLLGLAAAAYSSGIYYEEVDSDDFLDKRSVNLHHHAEKADSSSRLLEALIKRGGVATNCRDLDLWDDNSACKAEHDEIRRHHNVGDLTVDDGLKAAALVWARKKCESACTAPIAAHSVRPGGEGENVARSWASGSTVKGMSCPRATDNWYKERYQFGDYPYNAGTPEGKYMHFTQLVWKGATKIGCGGCSITYDKDGATWLHSVVVCQYDKGNMQGQFPANVLQVDDDKYRPMKN